MAYSIEETIESLINRVQLQLKPEFERLLKQQLIEHRDALLAKFTNDTDQIIKIVAEQLAAKIEAHLHGMQRWQDQQILVKLVVNNKELQVDSGANK